MVLHFENKCLQEAFWIMTKEQLKSQSTMELDTQGLLFRLQNLLFLLFYLIHSG